MANKTINTRLILRNDSLANWTNSTVKLLKGEVALAKISDENNNYEVRVGVGDKTWSELGSSNIVVPASAISNLVSTIQSNETNTTYQIVADTLKDGETGHAFKLQSKEKGADTWTDVDGSRFVVPAFDTTDIDTKITTLSTDLGTLSSDVGTFKTNVESTYLKSADFASLSTDIGLDRANSGNKVATMDDIKEITGVMHFRGTATLSADDESSVDCLNRTFTTPANGDVVVITTNSKEFIYVKPGVDDAGSWVELGDESLYAKTTDVETLKTNLEKADKDLGERIDNLSSEYAKIATVEAVDDRVDELSTYTHALSVSQLAWDYELIDCGTSA